jgi:hypothetical protein
MPNYAYHCPSCEHGEERHVPVEERNDQRCHACHMLMLRDFQAEQASTRGDYVEPILSEAAGVMPSQVAEHRRVHPDIPITNDGRVVFTSHSQRKQALRKLGMVDRDGFD